MRLKQDAVAAAWREEALRQKEELRATENRVKEVLEKQMQLLFERSQSSAGEELAQLSGAMSSLADVFFRERL